MKFCPRIEQSCSPNYVGATFTINKIVILRVVQNLRSNTWRGGLNFLLAPDLFVSQYLHFRESLVLGY